MYSDKETEKQLQILEKRIKSEYTKAWKESKKTCDDYFKQFEKQDEKMREALENGTYPTLYGVNAGLSPEEHYKRWRLAHIGIGKRWEKVRDDLANRISNANIIASSYINDTTAGIYSLNYNYSAYEIEKDSSVSFDIYDENTVKRLIEDKNHTEFRTVKVDPERDYNWNTKRIQSELISGIVQGKSIKHLTDGFMHVMGSNRSSAIRNARTAVTSAQNGGRQDCYNKAVEMGIEMEKEWIATHDERTRESHIKLDGVRVAYNQKFPNKLMYPADPEGEPAEVYNCRCTMRAILKTNKQPRTENTVDSYNEWLNEKKKQGKTVENIDYKQKIKDAADQTIKNTEDIEKYKNEVQNLYLFGDVAADKEKIHGLQNKIDSLEKENITLKKEIEDSDKKIIRKIVDGNDISGDVEYEKDGFYIDQIIQKQGFNGLPTIMNTDDFKKAMKESGFYAERTYSADSQKTLEEYKFQLRYDKFYVDCGEGGAQHGQGMYCAGCYDLSNKSQLSGIGWEMSHYKTLGNERGYNFNHTEGLTLRKDAKIFKIPAGLDSYEYINEKYDEHIIKKFDLIGNNDKLRQDIRDVKECEDMIALLGDKLDKKEISFNQYETKMNEWYEKKYEIVDGNTDYKELYRKVNDYRLSNGKMKDIGVKIAEMGYDAINAEGHGESGSYTVVLNRTKLIIHEGGSLYGN